MSPRLVHMSAYSLLLPLVVADVVGEEHGVLAKVVSLDIEVLVVECVWGRVA